MGVGLDDDELEIWISLVRISKLLPARLDAELRAAGTTLPSYEILSVLSTAPDGLRISELGALALVSKPRMSLHVATLESDGLVERRPDPTDGRASIVRLTEAGRSALDRWSPAHVALARTVVADHLGPVSERDTMRTVLHRIRRELGDDWEP